MTRKQAYITLVVTGLTYVGLYVWGLISFPEFPFVTYWLALLILIAALLGWASLYIAGWFIGLSFLKRSWFHGIGWVIQNGLALPFRWAYLRIFVHGWRTVLEGLLSTEPRGKGSVPARQRTEDVPRERSLDFKRKVRGLIGSRKEERK